MSLAGKGVFVLLAISIVVIPTAGEEDRENNSRGRTEMEGADWQSLLHGTKFDGWIESEEPWTRATWSREGETITGRVTGHRKARITQGDSSWTDYEFSVKAKLVEGEALQLHFRVSDGGSSFYMIDLWPGSHGAVLISKRGPNTDGVAHLNKVDFPFEEGREYEILISARGRSLTCTIDGELVNQVIDDSYSGGGVGFNLWHPTTATFKNPRVRHYR